MTKRAWIEVEHDLDFDSAEMLRFLSIRANGDDIKSIAYHETGPGDIRLAIDAHELGKIKGYIRVIESSAFGDAEKKQAGQLLAKAVTKLVGGGE